MKMVIQRVTHASVEVDSEVVGKINHGLLVLLGVSDQDSQEQVVKYCKKLLEIRIFSDENGRMNQSIMDVSGEVLIVSQFTLYGSLRKGRRPSFSEAGRPEHAKAMYEKCIEELEARMPRKLTLPTAKAGGFFQFSFLSGNFT